MCFANPHVIGKNSAQTQFVEGEQPGEAFLLVITQMVLIANRGVELVLLFRSRESFQGLLEPDGVVLVLNDGDCANQAGELPPGENDRIALCLADGAAIFGKELIQPSQRPLVQIECCQANGKRLPFFDVLQQLRQGHDILADAEFTGQHDPAVFFAQLGDEQPVGDMDKTNIQHLRGNLVVRMLQLFAVAVEKICDFPLLDDTLLVVA